MLLMFNLLSHLGDLALCLTFFIMRTSQIFVGFSCFNELDFPGIWEGDSCEGVG